MVILILKQHGDARYLIAEARLLPHAGERDGIPSGGRNASAVRVQRFRNLAQTACSYLNTPNGSCGCPITEKKLKLKLSSVESKFSSVWAWQLPS